MLEPLSIDERHELLLDDGCIEWKDRLERKVCPAVKHPDGPLIYPVEDGEPAGYVFGSVLRDEDENLFKAWLMGYWKRVDGRAVRDPLKGLFMFLRKQVKITSII